MDFFMAYSHSTLIEVQQDEQLFGIHRLLKLLVSAFTDACHVICYALLIPRRVSLLA